MIARRSAVCRCGVDLKNICVTLFLGWMLILKIGFRNPKWGNYLNSFDRTAQWINNLHDLKNIFVQNCLSEFFFTKLFSSNQIRNLSIYLPPRAQLNILHLKRGLYTYEYCDTKTGTPFSRRGCEHTVDVTSQGYRSWPQRNQSYHQHCLAAYCRPKRNSYR